MIRASWFVFRTFFFLALIGALSAYASDKKGIGLAERSEGYRVTALQVSWYYTWSPKPLPGVQGKEFVPMVWGGKRTDAELKAVSSLGRVPVLLAINEPDHTDQAHMSEDDIVRYWPELESTSVRISSPAPAGASSAWFDNFLARSRREGLKVDFLAVHLYGPPDAARFLTKIDALYARFGLPIWITEFAVADWDVAAPNCRTDCRNHYSEEQVLAFMKAVLPELEKRRFVERYAWFGAGSFADAHEELRPSRLFDKNGELTRLGRLYAAFQ
jgi:hypothetical protein